MIGDIIEINCCARLLQEINALNTNLVILFKLLTLVLKHENAVLLVWLILLRQNDLFKTDRFSNLYFSFCLQLEGCKFLHLEYIYFLSFLIVRLVFILICLKLIINR